MGFVVHESKCIWFTPEIPPETPRESCIKLNLDKSKCSNPQLDLRLASSSVWPDHV